MDFFFGEQNTKNEINWKSFNNRIRQCSPEFASYQINRLLRSMKGNRIYLTSEFHQMSLLDDFLNSIDCKNIGLLEIEMEGEEVALKIYFYDGILLCRLIWNLNSKGEILAAIDSLIIPLHRKGISKISRLSFSDDDRVGLSANSYEEELSRILQLLGKKHISAELIASDDQYISAMIKIEYADAVSMTKINMEKV